MSCSLQSHWRANLLLLLGLLLHCGEAIVLTEIQAGPLYRVVGSPLSIYCNVSGFSNPNRNQNFEIHVMKPARPTYEIAISSTNDPNFAFRVYSQRVRNGEITLTRQSPTSVVFEIKTLQKDDEGEFSCSVINSESVYLGTYSAKTSVKVIDNSLSVSSPPSTSLSYNEGDDLTLTCHASTNTVQHTHLSLAWYLHKDGEDNAQPIISLDRDFTLSPGQGFEGRYQAGLVRLDKVGEATYKLKIAQLKVSDQGRVYCQAQEWIQDPDGSWYSIAQKDGDESILTVKAREVVSDPSSLGVRISIQPTDLQEGQQLSLSCNVDTLDVQEKFFSVAWLKGGAEIARIGPTGILSVESDYSLREKEGELRAARIADRDYCLTLQPVRTSDQGEYSCKAWPQDRGQDGAFTPRAAQDSSSQLVSVSATENGFSLEMQSSQTVNEGDTMTLTCQVHGVRGQLSVTWQRKAPSTSTAAFSNVISLSQEGVMEKAEEFAGRKVKAARPAADTFTLELDEVGLSDSGVYQCAVNTKKNSQSQMSTVTVNPAESFVKVALISRNSIVAIGDNVELICRVKGSHVPMTVTWTLKRENSNIDNILTLYSDGSISWSGNQRRYQLKVKSTMNDIKYYLLINGVSHMEAGSYQCGVSVFLHNVHKRLAPSNPLAVNVQKPERQLQLTSAPTLTSNVNTDVEIKCSVLSEPSDSSRYAITWKLQQLDQNETIVSSDQDALITFGPQVEQSHRQRIGLRRTRGPSFELSIRQARTSDQGTYICEVVEWLQDPDGVWYPLSPASRATNLIVTELANDLRLDTEAQSINAIEGGKVELKCSIISGEPGPSLFYKVTWLYTRNNSSAWQALVSLDHTGLLTYPTSLELRDLEGRLSIFRPTQSSFFLRIQRAHQEDSGTYKCQVEQYQLDHESRWQQKASESGGPLGVTVKVAEKKLSISKEGLEFNVSSSHSFSIPCHVTSQPSSDSRFQVTWFWQKSTETEQPIFVAYINSTLQAMLWKGDQLRFSHPKSNQFNLTVLRPGPEVSGVYFCEVEEWLPSPSVGWRRAAVEKSGYTTVNVFAEEGVSVSQAECKLKLWTGIFVSLLVCSLLVIFALLVKTCRTNEGKKTEKSLWTEQHPLSSKAGAED